MTPSSDRGWDADATDDAPESWDSYLKPATNPELFYEGRPDDWDLDSVGIFVLNLGDHPEHLEQTEELRGGFSIITPLDEPDYDEL